MMRASLRLLVVGDARLDAKGVVAALGDRGWLTTLGVVVDEPGLLERLNQEPWQLILAQRQSAKLTALRLLQIVRERSLDVPVIVVSDQHTEGELVEVMRAGARDCLASRRLDALVAAVERELREAESRRVAGKGPVAGPGSDDHYRKLVEEIPGLLYVAWADEVGSRAYVSPQLQAMSGFAPVEWLAEPEAWSKRLHAEDRERVLREFKESCATREMFVSEYRLERRDGEVVWWHDEGRVLREPDGRAKFVRGFVRDVTEQRLAAETIHRMRFYDSLTGLPNRLLLHERLARTLVERESRPVALLMLALDRFREVNNVLGHQNGDLIVRELAQRLGQVLGETDRLARLRGDGFGVLLPDSDVPLARQVARKILTVLEQPFMVEGLPIEVGASIGIAAAPDHGVEAEVLLRRADLAMQAAKRLGAGSHVYSPDCDPYDPSHFALLGELRRAIESDQLFLHYQPKVDLKTRSVAGAEALLRWRHPRRGLVPPDDFIPLAEQAGLIKPLTWWVLRRAMNQCRTWEQQRKGLAVAVNLSARSLHDPQLIEQITELLGATGVDPKQLQLEVTESAVMSDPTRAVEILGSLTRQGVGVSIDDFGTGYSSLTYLRQLPVSELKIDKSFVIGMAGNGGQDKAIVRSTSELAHHLGLRVVAEGVENDRTLELLDSYGCDQAQGYFIARPMPPEDVAGWLSSSPWRLADS